LEIDSDAEPPLIVTRKTFSGTRSSFDDWTGHLVAILGRADLSHEKGSAIIVGTVSVVDMRLRIPTVIRCGKGGKGPNQQPQGTFAFVLPKQRMGRLRMGSNDRKFAGRA
jgi:hypothetical protein